MFDGDEVCVECVEIDGVIGYGCVYVEMKCGLLLCVVV